MTTPRILVIGRADDRAARGLAAHWADHGARLLTPSDLMVRGWRHDPADPDRDRAVVAGEVWPVDTITGVVTRLTQIWADDLTAIQPADRSYVAAELGAFLLSWLSALPCPVVNRPSPWHLCGPGWTRAEWTTCAARLGIPVVPVELGTAAREATPTPTPTSTSVTIRVIGHDPGEILGDVDDPTLVAHARALARATRTELLAVDFAVDADGPRFRGAEVRPPIDLDCADALLRRFAAGSASRKLGRRLEA